MGPELINPLNQNRAIPPNPNLISQVGYEGVVLPPGTYLSVFLDIFSVLAALAASNIYRQYLNGGLSIWYPVAAGSLFILVGISPLLFTKSLGRRGLVIFLQVIALLAFFWDQPFLFLIPIAAAAYFFLFWGEWNSRQNLENGLQVRFFQATTDYINKSLTALTMLAVLLFLPQWEAEQGFLSRDNFQSLYDSNSKFVNQFYGEFKLDGNFGEFAESFTLFQHSGKLAYEELLPPAKEKALAEGKAQFMRDLEQSWGVQVPEDKPLSSVVYEYLIRQFEKWRGTFGERFLAAWAVVMFFILRSFAYPLSIIISGLGYFIFQILLAMNLVHIRGETAMRERLEYS